MGSVAARAISRIGIKRDNLIFITMIFHSNKGSVDLVLVGSLVQTVSLHKLADAMPTSVDKDSNLRRLQRFFAKYVLDLDIIARMIFSLLPVKTGLVLSMDRIARLVAMVFMALVLAYLVGEHKDVNVNRTIVNVFLKVSNNRCSRIPNPCIYRNTHGLREPLHTLFRRCGIQSSAEKAPASSLRSQVGS